MFYYDDIYTLECDIIMMQTIKSESSQNSDIYEKIN